MIRALLIAPLLALVFVASTLAQNASVMATPAAATAPDWTSLLTPLVIALIPVLVALCKPLVPARFTVLYPLLATTLGPLGDLALSYLQARAADPKWGLAMGLMAIGVRELIDQARKVPNGPMVAKAIALALLLPALSGCAGLGGPWTAGMTPEQLHEMARIKDASVTCFTGTYAGAKINALVISADKGVPAGVQIDADCKASFMSGTRPGP